MAHACILGLQGTVLSKPERTFFRDVDPWGFILFKRNIGTPAQVSSLVQELRSLVCHADAPVLIDQEGGRVQRLGPPHWPVYPPGAVFGSLYDIDSALGLTAADIAIVVAAFFGGAVLLSRLLYRVGLRDEPY